MLFVRRLRLIDSAEDSSQWLSRAKTQWSARGPLAIRVRTTDGANLGSTIPKTLRRYAGPPAYWGLSWVEEGDGEERPGFAAGGTPTSSPPANAAQTLSAEVGNPTATPVDTTADNTVRENDQETATTPRQEGSSENESQDQIAPEATGDVEEDVPNPGIATPPVPRHGSSLSGGGDEDDFNPPEQRRQTTEGRPSGTAGGEPSSCQGGIATEECIPVDISGAVSGGGLAVVEVFSVTTGHVVASLPVDITAAFKMEASDVQHYALLMTPIDVASVDDTTVYGVLDLTVVHTDYALGGGDGVAEPAEPREGTSSSAAPTAQALVTDLCSTALPVMPVSSGAIRCSTTHLFFPSALLESTGAFLVSNVVAIESTVAEPVTVEFVTSGSGEGSVEVSPAQTARLTSRGERAYFVLTWNLFKPLAPSLHAHLLVRVGDENCPSVDLVVHGEPPRPGSVNPPYLFWINTTPVTNVSFADGELLQMQSILPVYKLAELLSKRADSS